ncbi:enterotoxin [Bacillus sp. AFS076308]|uniref:3D domain-containing protein n=1 Tax=unclassified Bacillus (in: firmicutes) TaxID=185979 RepID=UPI000BF86D62|nr:MULTISPECIES: 3D domain-containing protein [unclassified Bacillus (in: firmicutes)]PFN80552.1 enterotoxin [Bacillus sp. AFS076308]PGV53306.1 enterotoxin [Bacillus sp. AFS037270]
MRKIISMAAAAFIGFGLFTASAEAATVVNANVLNVRQSPATSSLIIGKVTNGQALDVKSRQNGWLKISYKGKIGYVSSQYTKETSTSTGGTYYVNASSLNVRSGAGTNYALMGKLNRGQAVNVKSDLGNGWYQISYNGRTGYVSKQYVVKTAVKAAAEFIVEATAYTPLESSSGMTAAGYNIRKNPNMKLIAVDPKVIPLGTKVWVEGYGEAIAGDTGGAIKGNKIDVLFPTVKQALQWGRKNVKVRILN